MNAHVMDRQNGVANMTSVPPYELNESFGNYNGSYADNQSLCNNPNLLTGHVNAAFVDAKNALNHKKLAVFVDKLRVSYGYGSRSVNVLKSIDLTLPRGQIYGLLGPSGCGKTTLLRCIVGKQKPIDGQVLCFGRAPGSEGSFIPGPGVGYMPQELTLFPEFTIEETLSFFGQLFRMPEEILRKRVEFLVDFLDLPNRKRLVKNLSGGQQRRVSLAAALIHKPALLILDEPTVGVDPLLRQTIWDYLVTLTREEGMTIIVTTHYIEEARQADIVGLLRSGRLLAQDHPDRLLKDFQCETLEDVFLQLCLADKEGRFVAKQPRSQPLPRPTSQPAAIECSNPATGEKKAINAQTNGHHQFDRKTKFARSSSKSKHALSRKQESDLHAHIMRKETLADAWCRSWALAVKNITRIKRNIPILLFTFLVPSFQIILFCMCIGGEPTQLPMAVVNLDSHPTLSNEFLGSIPPEKIVQRHFSNLDEAIASVERGETWGVLSMGESYSKTLRYRFASGIEADNQTIDDSTIDVFMDMTNQQIGFILQKTLVESFIEFCEKLLASINKNTNLAQLPIRVREPVYGSGKPSFTEFMAPGVILSITYIMAVGLTSTSITMETREGTMERCWVAGVKSFEVVISHVLSQFSIMLVQVATLLCVTFLVFNIPVEGSVTLVIILTLLQGLVGMTFGLVISSLCSEEQSAMMLALGTFYPNLLLSGIIWPVQSMPNIVKYISYGLPQTIPTETLRCIMYRAWGMEQQEVWMGFAISIMWTLFFLLFATITFKART